MRSVIYSNQRNIIRNRYNNSCDSGFSLIELLVVLVILGLLASLIVPGLLQKTERAKGKAAVGQVQLLSNAVTEYYLENGQPPETLTDLVPDFAKPSQLKDPWDRDYHYRYPGEHGVFDLYSLGADNASGGDGENKDITSWE